MVTNGRVGLTMGYQEQLNYCVIWRINFSEIVSTNSRNGVFMKLKDIRANPLADGSCLIQAAVQGSTMTVQRLLDEIGTNYQEWDLELSKAKKSRSNDSNKYSWKLSDMLADKLGIGKDECHIMLLARYGQTAEDNEGNKIIFSVDSKIDVSQMYKYIDVVGNGTVNGKQFTHYRALKGSSEFNTKEMSVFIEGIVSECKEQGIETMTPIEIEQLNEKWRANK